MKRSWHGWRAAAGMAGSLLVLLATAALATEVCLKDGRILRGSKGETVSLAEQNGAGEADSLKQIVFVNDDFRLIFVSRRQIVDAPPDATLENAEKFELIQQRDRIGRSGMQKVVSVGPPAGPLKDFDDWGRRVYPMLTASGSAERRPGHHRAHAAIRPGRGPATDMGHADRHEHALRREALRDPHAPDRSQEHRAAQEDRAFLSPVQAIQHGGGDLAEDHRGLQERHASRPGIRPTLKKLRIMYAQQMLDELGLRRASGQYDLVQRILTSSPARTFPRKT